jgi:hypothetical protein
LSAAHQSVAEPNTCGCIVTPSPADTDCQVAPPSSDRIV